MLTWGSSRPSSDSVLEAEGDEPFLDLESFGLGAGHPLPSLRRSPAIKALEHESTGEPRNDLLDLLHDDEGKTEMEADAATANMSVGVEVVCWSLQSVARRKM